MRVAKQRLFCMIRKPMKMKKLFKSCSMTSRNAMRTDKADTHVSLSWDLVRVMEQKWQSSNLFNAGDMIRAGQNLFHEVNPDRKSTRLNYSHVSISYAVFCLK